MRVRSADAAKRYLPNANAEEDSTAEREDRRGVSVGRSGTSGVGTLSHAAPTGYGFGHLQEAVEAVPVPRVKVPR